MSHYLNYFSKDTSFSVWSSSRLFLDFSFNMGGRVGTGGRWASVINTYTNGVLSTTATICFRGRILIRSYGWNSININH